MHDLISFFTPSSGAPHAPVSDATARMTREAAEKEIGQSVVSPMNAILLVQCGTPLIADATPDEAR